MNFKGLHIYKTIFIGFLLAINLSLQAQNDSFILSSPPQSEINFTFSLGKQSQIKYQVEKGQNPFLATKNHAWEFNANYALGFDQSYKISIGLIAGAGSFDAPFEITNSKFPGVTQYIGEDYHSGYFGISDQWYSDYYIALPLKVHYNIFHLGSKHRIWANAGVDFQYLFPTIDGRSYSQGYDSATYFQLIDFRYNKNPSHELKIRFNLGLEYRLQLPKYNELIFGINYAFHTSDMYSGTYEILQFDPNNAGHGTFSNRMDLLSFSLGYSINNKRKRYKQYQNHKNKLSDELILPPDTMPNIHEFRFGTNPKLYAWNPIEVPNTAATLEPKIDKYQITSFTFHYIKFITNNSAWYTGLDADFGAYNFILTLNKKDYPYLKQTYNIKHQELLHFLNIPIGLHHNVSLGKRSNIELSGALNLSFNLARNMSTGYSGPTTNSSYITLFNVNVDQINFITPGGQLNIGYSYETKRKNKWVIGVRGTMNFIKSYTMDYEILNPDKSYYQGKIDMQPFNLQLYWRYSLTGKRKRYMKAQGY